MTLWAFLLAAVGPLAIKVLAALGISAITFVGVDIVVGQLLALMSSNFGGFTGDTAAILGLAGVGKSLGIISGAITSRLALWSVASATRWVTGGL